MQAEGAKKHEIRRVFGAGVELATDPLPVMPLGITVCINAGGGMAAALGPNTRNSPGSPQVTSSVADSWDRNRTNPTP